MNTKGKIEKGNINMFLTLMDFIIMIIKHNLINTKNNKNY